MTKFALTWRYVSVLVLIACLSGGSYLLLGGIVAVEKQREAVIELNARQRTLSQRIVVLGLIVDRAPGPEVRAEALLEMRRGIEKLAQVQERLSAVRKAGLAHVDRELREEVDHRVGDFLMLAKRVVEEADAGLPISYELVHRLFDAGGLDFLARLDAVSEAYQGASRRAMLLLDRLQLASMAGTMFLLAFIGFVLFRPLVKRIVADRLELTVANEELERLATADALTGLCNRRKFDEVINREMELSKRYADPVSLLMFDIDHFKAINDSLGHGVGDRALVELSSLALHHVRSVDYVFRFGGEEFLILAPRTGLHDAFGMAEKLRCMVESHLFPDGVRMTISLGVAEHRRGESLEDWLTRVDKAMYAAKRGGRNRVMAG